MEHPIKIMRARAGFTQQQVADMKFTPVTAQYIRRVEDGLGTKKSQDKLIDLLQTAISVNSLELGTVSNEVIKRDIKTQITNWALELDYTEPINADHPDANIQDLIEDWVSLTRFRTGTRINEPVAATSANNLIKQLKRQLKIDSTIELCRLLQVHPATLVRWQKTNGLMPASIRTALTQAGVEYTL